MFSCPKCSNARLTRLADAPNARLDPAHEPMRCRTCHGLWLPPACTARLAAADSFEASTSTPKRARPDADRRAGLCPLGHGILLRARAELDPPFWLDRCPHCLGIWFEDGEWQNLAASEFSRELWRLWDPASRRAADDRRVDERRIEQLRGSLGPETVTVLEELAARLRGKPQASAALAWLRDAID